MLCFAVGRYCCAGPRRSLARWLAEAREVSMNMEVFTLTRTVPRTSDQRCENRCPQPQPHHTTHHYTTTHRATMSFLYREAGRILQGVEDGKSSLKTLALGRANSVGGGKGGDENGPKRKVWYCWVTDFEGWLPVYMTWACCTCHAARLPVDGVVTLFPRILEAMCCCTGESWLYCVFLTAATTN